MIVENRHHMGNYRESNRAIFLKASIETNQYIEISEPTNPERMMDISDCIVMTP